MLDEKGRSYCDQILKVSEHIAALVEQVNMFIVTKEAAPSFETSASRIPSHAQERISAQLSIRRIEWIEPDTEVQIEADRLSILRVFRNLIDNALKYGGERMSKISIGIKYTEFPHFLRSDNGKGLKGADSEKIFRMFHRKKTSRGTKGQAWALPS